MKHIKYIMKSTVTATNGQTAATPLLIKSAGICANICTRKKAGFEFPGELDDTKCLGCQLTANRASSAEHRFLLAPRSERGPVTGNHLRRCLREMYT
ncbi:hypothetical protein TcasGA2_TC007829 [Tribolium castaneum]|uniref:Uncharacterized protein n=1 Tax=Tribolium castaneum TaxID=7070 RepID=D2A2C8_TRICA|nr:hypothetical protein TcasGA2_TC007829 [Tribolium castaneum]